jgi:uncharacterized protein YbaP (TraB family)
MQKFLTSVATAALLLSPVAAGAKKTPAPVAITNAKPAMWVVKDADTTIYLFGTVHVLRPDMQWFNGSVKTAFDSSSELIVEMIEPDAATAQKVVIEKAIDKDGPALTKKLPAEAAVKYRAMMKDLGQPAEAFEMFEPWFISNLLVLLPVQKLGYDGEKGADKVLMNAAKASGKKLGELETMDQQLNFFDSMPEADQIAYLVSTIEDASKLDVELGKMVNSWAKGDPVGLDASMNEGLKDFPKMRKLLLTDRNANWAKWIDKRMDQPGTVFLAVGAGHLAGKDSVQNMLRAYKIKAKRVKG